MPNLILDDGELALDTELTAGRYHVAAPSGSKVTIHVAEDGAVTIIDGDLPDGIHPITGHTADTGPDLPGFAAAPPAPATSPAPPAAGPDSEPSTDPGTGATPPAATDTPAAGGTP